MQTTVTVELTPGELRVLLRAISIMMGTDEVDTSHLQIGTEEEHDLRASERKLLAVA